MYVYIYTYVLGCTLVDSCAEPMHPAWLYHARVVPCVIRPRSKNCNRWLWKTNGRDCLGPWCLLDASI